MTLPKGWTAQSLGSVLTFNYGKSLPAHSRRGGAVTVYGSNGPVGSHDQTFVKGPVIIVGRKGSIGEVHYSTEPCWPIDTTYFIDKFGDHCPEFWFWYLKHLQLGSLDRATAIPGLNRDDAYRSIVHVPPPKEQQRIVARVDNVFKRSKRAREEASRIPQLIARYKQTVLTAAFSGNLSKTWRSNGSATAPDRNLIAQQRQEQFFNGADRYEQPLSLPHENPPFVIPDQWLWFRCEAICDLITKGTTPPSAAMAAGAGEIPYIKVYNLTFTGELDFGIDPTFVSNETHGRLLKRSKVFPGDVLMNIVGPPLGKVSVVPSTSPEWNINQAIAVFRPVASIEPRFLAFWLLSENVLNWAVARSKATAGQSNLTLQICRDMPIPLCSLNEQRVIVRQIETLFLNADTTAKESKRAVDLVDRLEHATLAKVFRGELFMGAHGVGIGG